MAPPDPPQLVLLIVWLARQRGESLTTLRLVKYLYLADLYWAREHEGQTLTGWPWGFVHYGPFTGEALDAIQYAVRTGLVAAQPFRSKYTDEERHLYTVEDDRAAALADSLPDTVLGPLRDTIRRWADDTPALLDYVYFHTEPMAEARPGERLDFTKAVKTEDPRPVQMRQLSGHQIRKAKEAARALAARYRKSVEAARVHEAAALYDDDFVNALRAMGDAEPSRSEPVKGTARLKPS
jgi:hypothetical protein